MKSTKNVYFRVAAAAIIYRNNEFLMFSRSLTDTSYLQFPQGGLDGTNEKPKDAMWRELFEETALRPEQFEDIQEYPGWLGYYCDKDTIQSLRLRGISTSGQVQRCWFLKIKEKVEIHLDQAQDKEFESYSWIPLEAVVDSVIPFKKEMHSELIRYYKKYIQQ